MRYHADTAPENNTLPHKEVLMGKVTKWIEKITTAEFREYKRRQLNYVLGDDFERTLVPADTGNAFNFDDPIDKQHKLIMSFLLLNQAMEVLSQCEYYFRRYPFSKLPIPREDHARNMCEFYFGQFYVIECRIKKVLESLKGFRQGNASDPGRIIRLFQKEFSQELRMRGGAIHSEPFGHVDLDRLFVTRLMSTSPDLSDKGWDAEHLRHYRKFASTWSKRARRRSADAKLYLDAVAGMLLKHVAFLSE